MNPQRVVSFDTSSIRRLNQESDRTLALGHIRSDYRVALPGTSVEEIVATADEKERAELLDICEDLLSVGECLGPFYWLIEKLIIRYEREGASFNWRTVPMVMRAYEVEVLRRQVVAIGDQAAATQRNLSRQAEHDFASIFAPGRSHLEKLFRSGRDSRPEKVAEFVAVIQESGGLWNLGRLLYAHLAKTMPAVEEVKRVIQLCPPFETLLLSIVVEQFFWLARGFSSEEDSFFQSGTGLAAYLPYCDEMITNDARQDRSLQAVASLAGLEVSVVPYMVFRKRFASGSKTSSTNQTQRTSGSKPGPVRKGKRQGRSPNEQPG